MKKVKEDNNFPYTARIPNESDILTELDKDEIPQELEFFSGVQNRLNLYFLNLIHII